MYRLRESGLRLDSEVEEIILDIGYGVMIIRMQGFPAMEKEGNVIHCRGCGQSPVGSSP